MTPGSAYQRGALIEGVAAAWLLGVLRQHRASWQGFRPELRDELERAYLGIAEAATDYHQERPDFRVRKSEVLEEPVLAPSVHDEITIEQAAELMGVGPRQACNRVRRNELGVKRAGRWLVSESAVRQHLQESA